MAIGSRTPDSFAYVAGMCAFAAFSMFWKLGKDMVEAGQFRFAVGLGLASISLFIAIYLRDKWTADKSAREEQLKFNKKLEEIEFNLLHVTKERDGLSSDKELLLADLDAAYILRNEAQTQPLSGLVSEAPTATTTDKATSRAHVSDKLAILNQAAAKFWANADRDDPTSQPKKQDVVSWLMDRDFSKITAESGATIIKPEWAAKGRKPEE